MRSAIVLLAIFLSTPAYPNDKTPCWKIRKWVAQYGSSAVEAYARFNGYSARDIERGKRCLK